MFQYIAYILFAQSKQLKKKHKSMEPAMQSRAQGYSDEVMSIFVIGPLFHPTTG